MLLRPSHTIYSRVRHSCLPSISSNPFRVVYVSPGCSKRPPFPPANPGASKRASSKARRKEWSNCAAYPRGYVARRHTAESDAGSLFQQPSRLDGDVHKRRN